MYWAGFQIIRTCDAHPYYDQPIICILVVVNRQLNATLTNRIHSTSFLADLSEFWWEPDESYYLLRLRTNVPSLNSRNYYKLIVVVDLSELLLNNIKGIYNAMDKLTWVFLIV